jgi:hypothetical protein
MEIVDIDAEVRKFLEATLGEEQTKQLLESVRAVVGAARSYEKVMCAISLQSHALAARDAAAFLRRAIMDPGSMLSEPNGTHPT